MLYFFYILLDPQASPSLARAIFLHGPESILDEGGLVQTILTL